ncbi:MAG: endolytic transglycosylase MltG [Gammaproteobacteria bacterium]
MNRRALAVLLGVAIVSLLLLGGSFDQQSRLAMNTPVGGEGPRLVTIEPGTTLASLSRRLETEGFVSDNLYFRWRARWQGDAGRIQAGTYEALPTDTPAGLLRKFVRGDTKTFAVTFVEGTRFVDMLTTLADHPYIEHTLAGLDEAAIMAALGRPEQRAEGRFFPSTYHFKAHTADRELLARALADMDRRLEAAWQQRRAELPYASAYEALIMASIVEKETARPEERAAIAGVFVRRLRKGMKLQTDPTVIYGLGEAYDGNLRRADLERDTPWNTYTRAGLPPTPIALPGQAAIDAALQPAEGEALYFVARGDGSHQFSASLAEHDDAVRRYQLRASR